MQRPAFRSFPTGDRRHAQETCSDTPSARSRWCKQKRGWPRQRLIWRRSILKPSSRASDGLLVRRDHDASRRCWLRVGLHDPPLRVDGFNLHYPPLPSLLAPPRVPGPERARRRESGAPFPAVRGARQVLLTRRARAIPSRRSLRLRSSGMRSRGLEDPISTAFRSQCGGVGQERDTLSERFGLRICRSEATTAHLPSMTSRS
jgi:hypothetical protein